MPELEMGFQFAVAVCVRTENNVFACNEDPPTPSLTPYYLQKTVYHPERRTGI